MNTIDQRILIPTDPAIVWDYLSNLARSSEWQKDVKSVAFLSDRNSGQGTRVRYAGGRGRDQVLDIIAWYNGLGYEYIIVDGSAYKDNRGRIRLQEIPEGTVVQWTFSYEPTGIRGGRGGKAIESAMAESLRALYKEVTGLSKSMSHEAKSLMRSAPDVNARSQYRPRHPSAPKPENTPSEPMSLVPLRVASVSALEEIGPRAQESPFAPPASYRPAVMAEPPVDEGDTRPNPAVSAAAPPARPFDYTAEPDFLQGMNVSTARTWNEPTPENDDARMMTLPRFDFDDLDAPTIMASETPEAEAELLETVWATLPDRALPTEKVTLSKTQAARVDEKTVVNPVYTPPESVADTRRDERRDAIEIARPITPDPMLPVSTESIKSIWEVFNVTRPSDSQVMRALEQEEERARAALSEASPEIIAPIEPAPESEIESVRPSLVETMLLDPVIEIGEVFAGSAEVDNIEGIGFKTMPVVVPSESMPIEPGDDESAWLPRTGYRLKLRRRIVRLRRPMILS